MCVALDASRQAPYAELSQLAVHCGAVESSANTFFCPQRVGSPCAPGVIPLAADVARFTTLGGMSACAVAFDSEDFLLFSRFGVSSLGAGVPAAAGNTMKSLRLPPPPVKGCLPACCPAVACLCHLPCRLHLRQHRPPWLCLQESCSGVGFVTPTELVMPFEASGHLARCGCSSRRLVQLLKELWLCTGARSAAVLVCRMTTLPVDSTV